MELQWKSGLDGELLEALSDEALDQIHGKRSSRRLNLELKMYEENGRIGRV